MIAALSPEAAARTVRADMSQSWAVEVEYRRLPGQWCRRGQEYPHPGNAAIEAQGARAASDIARARIIHLITTRRVVG